MMDKDGSHVINKITKLPRQFLQKQKKNKAEMEEMFQKVRA